MEKGDRGSAGEVGDPPPVDPLQDEGRVADVAEQQVHGSAGKVVVMSTGAKKVQWRV